jgi:hypothetical protein
MGLSKQQNVWTLPYVHPYRIVPYADSTAPFLKATNDNHPTRLLITIPLVLSCMIVDDLPAEFDPPSQLLSDRRTYTDPRQSLR